MKQELIGRKIKGFKFEVNSPTYQSDMDKYIGEIGLIKEYIEENNSFQIDFKDDYWFYPASLIEQHLVDESPKLEFRPISMRCTQEQFNEVRPILESNGCEVEYIHSFDICPILVNNLADSNKFVSNVVEEDANSRNRTYYPEWNKEIFLNACGIAINPFNIKVPMSDKPIDFSRTPNDIFKTIEKEESKENPFESELKNYKDFIKKGMENNKITESSNPLDNLPIIGEGVDALVSNTGMVENRAKVYCKIKDVYIAILEGSSQISTWFLAEPITPKTKITRAEFERQFEIID